MSYIKKNLNDNELLNYHSRISIKPIIMYYISTAVILYVVFSSVNDSIASGIVASIVGILFYTPFAIINYFGSEFGITANRVISKKGIISRNVSEMNLDSIESINVDQGIVGRILNYGTVKISGRGITAVNFEGIDDPVKIRKLIQNKN